jgi:hypothetical protein
MVHRKKTAQRQWYRMDLHLHTPASADFKQPNVTFLDFLRKAEEKNLDIIAFTDHNSVRGYAQFLEEIESLELLERLKRLRDDEKARLAEYRRLREKMLILPGFEFTATLGFHILGIFPPETTVRELEHLLLSLRVPAEKLDQGSGEVGATTDALTAYRMIDEAGGMAIAAHANSSHGVAMPGFDFGGQTRIAYTQDPHLLALEVTDLDSKSRRRTAAFFSGTKPEYPRRMHCIQGSDAHKLDFDPKFKNEMGVGDRATEILLDELSFDAIKAVFTGNDFSRTRPYRPTAAEPFDPLREAREQGDTLIQSFHEHLLDKRAIARTILQDVVALANTNGGTIYIGASADVRKPVVGVDRPEHAAAELRAAIAKAITPPLEVQIEVLKSQGKNVLQVIVPRGSQVPYVLDDSLIYVRSENETGLAVRDEIIQLVRDALMVELAAAGVPTPTPVVPEAPTEKPAAVVQTFASPRTGVEIVSAEQRKGVWYYSVRDLRNARVVHNVTLKSARRLWQYAITEREKSPPDPKKLKWVDDMAIVKTYRRGGKLRYDLAQRVGDKLFVYYGVTEDGIHGPWRHLVEGEPIIEEAIPEIAEVVPPVESITEEEFIAPIEAEQEPESVAALHPLIIEEEVVTPAPESPVVETEQPMEEVQPEPPSSAPWIEEVAFAGSEIVEEETPKVAEELPPTPAASEPEPANVEPSAPPEETPPAQMISAPPAPLVQKSRAQEWREQLERAMEEARKAKERQQTSDDRQQTTEDRAQTSDDGQQTTEDEEPSPSGG